LAKCIAAKLPFLPSFLSIEQSARPRHLCSRLAEANGPAVTPCSSEELGYTKAAKLLQPLDEERATDAALTKLAKSVINLDAEKDQAA
jgi:hypothetical protein